MVSRTADEIGPFTSLMRLIFKNFLIHISITIGMFGNILTLIVLSQKKMRRSSTTQYLIALTLFDIIYIISIFFNNLEILYSNIKSITEINPFLNLVFYPLGDFSSNTSVYLILIFTIERYIAVAYPLNSLSWFRPSRARRFIFLTILFTFFLTFPTFLENKIVYVLDLQNNKTRPHLVQSEFYSNFDLYKLIYFWIISLTVQFIPIFLLIILNIVLMKYIHLSKKMKIINENQLKLKGDKNKRLSFDLKEIGRTSIKSYKTNSQQQTDQNKATILLVATVLLFLICQLPSALLLIYEAIFPIDNQTSKFQKDVILGLNNIANGLIAINASVNFILYSCFSEKFRQTFRNLFSFKNNKNNSSTIRFY